MKNRVPERVVAVFRAWSAFASISAILIFLIVEPALAGSAAPGDEIEMQPNAEIQPPASVVEGFHERLIDVMKNADTMAYESRRERLAPAVRHNYDSAFMARVASGPHWKGMSEAERQEVVDSFRAFTLANYAGRFNGYSGQEFETLDSRDQGKGRVFVRTRLKKGDGDSIRLDYLLHQVSDQWKIVDVFLDGKFSELALRRSEFAPILKRGGADALIDLLKAKVKELEATSR